MVPGETPVLALIAGALLLIAGRRLFWLFVGLVGFMAAYSWFEPYAAGAPSWRWAVAVAAGLAGIVLAIFLQRVAVALAGFLVGGWFVTQLMGTYLPSGTGGRILVYLLGGILAAILAVKLFEIALVVLSSLAGAGLIVEALRPDPGLGRLLLVVLVVIGLAIQLGFTARRRRPQ